MFPNAVNPDEGVGTFFFSCQLGLAWKRENIQSKWTCLGKGKSVSGAKKNPLCLVGN